MSELSQEEVLEKLREKVFFYVSYQKRTELEIKRTFMPLFKKFNISRDVYNDLIEELKEKGYIDDADFVRRKFVSYTNLKPISVKEISFKILQKGISQELIDDYIEKNQERIREHQIKSVKQLYEKKISEKSEEEVKQFLRRKGFTEDIIKEI